MDQMEQDAALFDRLIKAIAGWEDRPYVIEPAIPVLASPSWRGVDGNPLLVRDTETAATLFIKQMHADTGFYIDIPSAFDAAAKAGEAGIGPKVLKTEIGSGILIMENLSADWRVAGLEKGYDADFVDRVLEKRRAFSALEPLLRTVSVFDDIERYFGDMQASGAQAPADLGWLVDTLRLAAEAVGTVPVQPRPIHGDGNVSNVLVNRAGDVRLVDYDRAGNGDPLEDIGSFLVEAFAFEPEARDAFYRFAGRADEAAFNRARIFGIADDLRWGMIGALQSHLSARKTTEFYKFASWRFLRCRMAVRDPRFGERLRRVA